MRAKNVLWIFLGVGLLIAPGVYLLLTSPLSLAAQGAVDEVRYVRNQVGVAIRSAKVEPVAEERLREIRKRYEVLAAKANALLRSVELGLDAGRFAESELQKQAHALAEDADALIAYVDGRLSILVADQPQLLQAGIGEDLVQLVKALSEGAILVWREGLAARDKRVEAIKAVLDQDLWPGWEAL